MILNRIFLLEIHIVYYFALTTAYNRFPISAIYPVSRGLGILGGSLFGVFWLQNRVTPIMIGSVGLILFGIVMFLLIQIDILELLSVIQVMNI